MKVNDPTRPARVRKVTTASSVKGAAAPEAVKPAADVTTVLGVPEAELTPKVRAALFSLIEDIQNLRAELDQARNRIDELEALADRDAMLDVFNRRAFARELDRTLGLLDRYQWRASLVFIDLNDLKKINDRLGHAAGDAALVHVSKTLTGNVRQTDVVARLGGDEFALLLLQADETIAKEKAQSIADLIVAEPVGWDGEVFHASVSWGAVEIHKGVSAQEALNQADEAMYQAKKQK